jgi:hypothetical protein
MELLGIRLPANGVHRAAQRGQIALTLGHRGNGAVLAESLPAAKCVEAGKEEGPVLDHRATDAGAKLVADQFGLLALIQGIGCVQHTIPQVFVGKSVHFVTAAAGDHIHLAAGVPAILRAIGVGFDLELLDRVDRGLQDVAVYVLVVIIHAVQQEVVVLFARSIGVHGEGAPSGVLRALYRRRYAGGEQSELQKISLIERQTANAVLINHHSQIGRFGGDRRLRGRHGNRLWPARYRQVEIDPNLLIYLKLKV